MRTPLKKNTLIRMEDRSVFLITGDPIGFGSISLIYPAVELFRGSSKSLPCAIKECFPANGFQRDTETMEIQSESKKILGLSIFGKNKKKELDAAKTQIWREKKLTENGHIRSRSIVPVRKVSMESELSFDSGKTFYETENAYSVMDDLTESGVSIKTLLDLETGKCFSVITALHIAEQVLVILEELYEQGILHLDISEGNVFVQGDPEKENCQISLIDLSCARRRGILPDRTYGKVSVDSSEKLFNISRVSPPELQEGGCELGPETDVFSVGCLLFRMLTGRYFSGPTESDRFLTSRHLAA